MQKSDETNPVEPSDLDGVPLTRDNIDVDRIIWDPAYRSAVNVVLARDAKKRKLWGEINCGRSGGSD